MKRYLFTGLVLFGLLLSLKAQIYTPSGTIQGSSGNNNVGIGVTDPDAKLEINGGLKVETDVAEFRLASTHAGGQTFVLRSHIGGVTYTGFEVFDETNSLNRFTISNDGKIGLGNTTPEAKLHIRENVPLGSTSGNYQIVSIQNATTNNNFYKKEFVFRESNGNDWTTTSWFDGIDVDGAFPVPMSSMKCWYKRTPYGDNVLRHAWGNGSNTFLGISSGGNIGIGTSSPVSKLDVSGNIALNDNYFYFRSGSDTYHGIIYSPAYDGPFLYGNGGLALGTSGGSVVNMVLKNSIMYPISRAGFNQS